MLMTTTYHFKIEKVKFDKNVNIPIPGTLKFLVPREDLLEIHDSDILKFFKKYANELTEKEVKNGKSEDGNNYRRGRVSGN